jgi:hypothetical protein
MGQTGQTQQGTQGQRSQTQQGGQGQGSQTQQGTMGQSGQNQQGTMGQSGQNQQGTMGQSGQNQHGTMGQGNNQNQMGNQGQYNQSGQQYLNHYNRINKKTLKEAIETQLQAKGFTKETNNPDLLVSYMVLDEPTQLRTFRRGTYTYLGEGPTGNNVEMVDVEPGAILVNFTDAETGSQVWQGFASAALEESDLKDDQTIKAKIAAIFQEFDFSGFSLGNNNQGGGNR